MKVSNKKTCVFWGVITGLFEKTELNNKKSWVFWGVITGLLERTELNNQKAWVFWGVITGFLERTELNNKRPESSENRTGHHSNISERIFISKNPAIFNCRKTWTTWNVRFTLHLGYQIFQNPTIWRFYSVTSVKEHKYTKPETNSLTFSILPAIYICGPRTGNI